MNVAAINRAFGSRHVRTGDECYDNVVEFHDSEVPRPGSIMREIRAFARNFAADTNYSGCLLLMAATFEVF